MKFLVMLIVCFGVLYNVGCHNGDDDLQVVVTKSVESCEHRSENGDTLYIHYVGKLEDGTEFDSSYNRGRPYVFTIGRGEVIRGVDIGLLDMCETEKRRLTIPSHLAYGDHGVSGVIPGGATIIFDYELVKIERNGEL